MLEVTSTPAVVLNCFRHSGLAIVRSLGRLGVPVYAVHGERTAPAFYSRYCYEGIVWDVHTAPPEESLRFLEDLGRRIGRRSLLITTSDIGAVFVASYAKQLANWFIFPEQNLELVQSLRSKKEMYYLAKKWGVPTPEAVFPCSRTDVEDYLAAACFPLLLKPISSRASRLPLWMVQTKQELLEHLESIQESSIPDYMIQEYIPGGDEMTWMFNGYFDHTSDCKIGFTGRKLRNYPPYFGGASLGVCAHNEEVARMTVEFMKAIGYRGPLDIGYRYDTRDGRYKVHDVNPRIGATFRLFVGQNGMDVARALYQDMTGQQVQPAALQEGRKWIVEDCDWISALRYHRDGKLTLRGWYESLRGIDEMSFIAKDDLWPIMSAISGIIREVLRYAWTRLKGLGRRQNASQHRVDDHAAEHGMLPAAAAILIGSVAKPKNSASGENSRSQTGRQEM
jgi:predicted ATP-grasp superfamily ATP-dependent carboligase